MPLSNARISYEPHRGDGALCISFKDREEAVFFAEGILQEVRSLENDSLSVSDCVLVTINFGEQGKLERLRSLQEAFQGQEQNVVVSVPDRAEPLVNL